PPHPGPAADDIDHALELPVMMWPGPRAGTDRDGPYPQLPRAGPIVSDRRGPAHPGGLRGVRIQRVTGNHPYAFHTPVGGHVPVHGSRGRRCGHRVAPLRGLSLRTTIAPWPADAADFETVRALVIPALMSGAVVCGLLLTYAMRLCALVHKLVIEVNRW